MDLDLAIRSAIDALTAYAEARDLALDVASRGLTVAGGVVRLLEQRHNEVDAAFDRVTIALGGSERPAGRIWWERSWLVMRGLVDVDAWTRELHEMAQAEAEEALAEESAEEAEELDEARADQLAEYRAAVRPW